MAWVETKGVIRDIVLLALGTLGIVHELFLTGTERPLILGAALSCLGLPLASGIRK